MTRVIPRSEQPEDEARGITLEPGMRLGRYELLCKIAEGGMAQVWAAEQAGDLGFRKLIALKTIRPDFAHDASFRAMFLDEAQLASRIRHVNVVEVLDLGAEGEVVFQAMALVDGASLSDWARTARLPVGVASRVAVDMLRGLHAAHELKDDDGHDLGLVHRDVSPQNVLVGADGVAKLADFGIAKAFGRATEETYAGDMKGKIAYVAPEQLVGYPASPQSDLFSAGAVFWELLTGDRLFRLPLRATPDARRGLTARDPRTIAADVPASVAAIVMRALDEDPFARYPTSLEMADALEEAVRREGLDATHRHVAAQLKQDLGMKLEARREQLRLAKKRSGLLVTPTPPRGPSLQKLPAAPALEPQAATEMMMREALPPTAVIELREGMTDTVTVAEAPSQQPFAPMFAVAERPPARPRRGGGQTLPLLLASAMLIAVVVVVGSLQRRPPAPVTPIAASVPPPPVVTPMPPPAPLPPATVAEPAPPPPPPSAAPSVTTAHKPPPAPAPHKWTRPAPKAPAPAPAPAAAAPRFENPY